MKKEIDSNNQKIQANDLYLRCQIDQIKMMINSLNDKSDTQILKESH